MGLLSQCSGMITIHHISYARHGNHKATFEIDSLRVLDGKLPPRALGLAVEWASQHREELMRNWEKARKQSPLEKIDPLL